MMIAANILCDLLYIGSIEAWSEYIALEILCAVHKIDRVGFKYFALALELSSCERCQCTGIQAAG
jgi:hypothetical protein